MKSVSTVFKRSELKLKLTEKMSSLFSPSTTATGSSMTTTSMTHHDDLKKKNILIGCSGSVASMKIPLLVKKLLECKCFNVKVVATEHARHFFTPEDICEVELFTDEIEWKAWNKREDPVVHIALCKWADLFLIAPLDANTMAKITGGICDNLLTCVARAWVSSKPFLFCPAMNTQMYLHPLTAVQIAKLTSWGYIEVPVICKVLICGDKGVGAMAEVDTIVQSVLTRTSSRC